MTRDGAWRTLTERSRRQEVRWHDLRRAQAGDDVDEAGRWRRDEGGTCFVGRGDPILTAADVESVDVGDVADRWHVIVQLSPGGQNVFERDIADQPGSRWLVVVGGAPTSVPVVNPDIVTDHVVAEGFSDEAEADRAAGMIRSIIE